MEGTRNPDSRDKALELVKNGIVSAEAMLTMCLMEYMSTDDVADMLDCYELSERFMDEDEYETTADNPDPYGESSPENVMNYLGIAK